MEAHRKTNSVLILAERIHQLQELRRQLIQEQCRGDPEAFLDGKNSLNDISNEEFSNFIVDDHHGIVYCYIPKVMAEPSYPHHDTVPAQLQILIFILPAGGVYQLEKSDGCSESE